MNISHLNMLADTLMIVPRVGGEVDSADDLAASSNRLTKLENLF